MGTRIRSGEGERTPVSPRRGHGRGPRTAADESLDDVTLRLAGGPGPLEDRLALLGRADTGAGIRAVASLQGLAGNGRVQHVIRAIGTGQGHGGAGRGSGDPVSAGGAERHAPGSAADTVLRSPDEGPAAEPAPAGSGEVLEPLVETTWSIDAATLADVAAVIAARPEAGHVSWQLDHSYTTTGGKVDTSTITARITLEMPDWTPPAGMLPAARAEWQRFYDALRAHEQGHIDLVERHVRGLAARLTGRTESKARQAFEAAKARLARASRAYDRATKNGRPGTIIDVSIESRELEAARKERPARP